jgi:hypothetical protein
MQLKPIAPDYNAVLNGTKQIGKIYDSEKNGENIVSGRIFIDTDDTGLTIFNKF